MKSYCMRSLGLRSYNDTICAFLPLVADMRVEESLANAFVTGSGYAGIIGWKSHAEGTRVLRYVRKR